MTSRKTTHTHTHSFAAGFITASVFFMIPLLLVPNLRAEFIYSETTDYSMQDIDNDGIDDAYDTDISSAMPDMSGDAVETVPASSSSIIPVTVDDIPSYSSSSMYYDMEGVDTVEVYDYNSASSAAIETGIDCDGDGYMDDPCSYACWEDMDGDGVMDDPCSS